MGKWELSPTKADCPLIISAVPATKACGACGPTCTDNKYNVAGPPILQTITTPWANAWPADMALTGANEMCQVNVGGDNGIYCWDTSTGASTRHIAGAFAWTNTSQRGLA